jgi:hypothetical protein
LHMHVQLFPIISISRSPGSAGATVVRNEDHGPSAWAGSGEGLPDDGVYKTSLHAHVVQLHQLWQQSSVESHNMTQFINCQRERVEGLEKQVISLGSVPTPASSPPALLGLDDIGSLFVGSVLDNRRAGAWTNLVLSGLPAIAGADDRLHPQPPIQMKTGGGASVAVDGGVQTAPALKEKLKVTLALAHGKQDDRKHPIPLTPTTGAIVLHRSQGDLLIGKQHQRSIPSRKEVEFASLMLGGALARHSASSR